MSEGYRTIVSKQDRSALLGPIRDHVMAHFAGEGTTWTGKAASNKNGAGGGDGPTYDAKEVKVALKVSHRATRCHGGSTSRALFPPSPRNRLKQVGDWKVSHFWFKTTLNY